MDCCVKCCSYCNSLRALLSQEKRKHMSAKRTHPSSHTNLCRPLKRLLDCIDFRLQRSTHKQLEHLKAKLAAAVERNSWRTDEPGSNYYCGSTVSVHWVSVHWVYVPPRLIPAIVLEAAEASQFLQGCSLDEVAYPHDKVVCLHHLSSSTYETLRDSGCYFAINLTRLYTLCASHRWLFCGRW